MDIIEVMNAVYDSHKAYTAFGAQLFADLDAAFDAVTEARKGKDKAAIESAEAAHTLAVKTLAQYGKVWETFNGSVMDIRKAHDSEHKARKGKAEVLGDLQPIRPERSDSGKARKLSPQEELIALLSAKNAPASESDESTD